MPERTISADRFVTVPALGREIGAPTWAVRKVVDDLGFGDNRFGFYRLVDRRHIPAIEAESRRRGYIKAAVPAGAA